MAKKTEPAPSFRNLLIGVPTTILYKNWKGVTAKRQITPMSFWYGSTEFHTEPQMLLTAWDTDKKQYRDFAVKDIKPVDWSKDLNDQIQSSS